MLKIKEAIVVEGVYDKSRLSSVVDTLIVTTNGFQIMQNHEKLEFLKSTAMTRGLIVFTDPDGAGLVIRNYLKSAISPEFLKHAYIPQLVGKEPRKVAPSKSGLLGVEGIDGKLLLRALQNVVTPLHAENLITKADLFKLGLYGGAQCSVLRAKLHQKLMLPAFVNVNGLIDVLSSQMTLEQLKNLVEVIRNE